MTQPNGTKGSKTRSLDEGGGHNTLNPHPTSTRSVFQNLLDNVRMLSEDKAFGSILMSMDKVPAMEDEIKRLREEEKLSTKSQRQLLETFNQDRDDLKAKHKQLQKEKTGLQEEIMQKVESTKTHEAAEKQQADQIQSLRKSEAVLAEDLDQSVKQAQGLIKAIEAEKQKSRSLQASLDVQKAELANTNAELQQLHKTYQNLQHRADWDAKELRLIAELSIPLKDEPPNLQPFGALWYKIASVISSTFSKDVSFGCFKIETFRSNLDRLGRWSKDLPLSESNSQAAKEMRSVAILASVSRVFVRQLFRPTYLLSADSGIPELLHRQVRDQSLKESRLRAAILALLPQEQEAAIAGAIRTTCKEILDLTSGLLSSSDAAEFQERLKDLVEEACEMWQGICRHSDAVRPDFELTDYEDSIWEQMFFEEGLPVFSGLGQIQDYDPDAVLFAIFPRLHVSFDGEEYPDTCGVLFMTSCAQAARKEGRSARMIKPARNDSIRNRLLRSRRPSNKPNLPQEDSRDGLTESSSTA